MAKTSPLQGIRVFDLTHAVAGPWASMLLGTLGADVMKVEPPAGDLIRILSPKQRGVSVQYIQGNVNKRGTVLDLKNSGDREAAYRLLAEADIFMENMRPGAVDRLGLGYDQAAKINPRIIYASISGWGDTGPLRDMGGNDLLVQAFSGWASLSGESSGRPEILRYVAHLDITCATFLLGALLQALLIRQRTGQGMKVDLSLLGSAMFIQINRMAEYFATGKAPSRLGSATASSAPHQAFLCRDRKWLAVGATSDAEWEGLCRAMGIERLTMDPRFATNNARVAHLDALAPILEEVFASKPSEWWTICLTREGVPNSRFLDFQGIRHHPQVVQNQLMTDVDIPRQGRMVFGGLPWRFDHARAQLSPRALPTLDVSHSSGIDETLARWKRVGRSAAAGGLRRQAGAAPLDGIVVIDSTQGLCGPFASMLLADAGAQVIKIEPPTGDSSRTQGTFWVEGDSPAHASLNRGKKSVALDFSIPAGRAALLRLLRTADVFLEDMGPGRAGELGLDHARLARRNRGLIRCSLTPFGERGPLKDRPGAELVYQAMSDYWGSLGAIGEAPERLGADIAHLNTGAFAFVGILTALYRRAVTGRGDRVSLSLLGTLLHMRSILWGAQSDPDEWFGNYCDSYVNPRDVGWQTKDCPIYFNLGRADEPSWISLVTELGMACILEDDRFIADGGRAAVGMGPFAEEAKPIWEEAFRDRMAEEVISILRRHGANAVAINDYTGLFAHPHTASLDLLRELRHPKAGRIKTLAPPWKLAGQSPVIGRTSPALGEHTEEVLRAVGLADVDLAALQKAGAIPSGVSSRQVLR